MDALCLVYLALVANGRCRHGTSPSARKDVPAGLRGAAAHLRPADGGGSQERRRPRRRCQGDRHRRDRRESRGCATPPVRWPGVPGSWTASLLPGSSTARSARWTTWPA